MCYSDRLSLSIFYWWQCVRCGTERKGTKGGVWEREGCYSAEKGPEANSKFFPVNLTVWTGVRFVLNVFKSSLGALKKWCKWAKGFCLRKRTRTCHASFLSWVAYLPFGLDSPFLFRLHLQLGSTILPSRQQTQKPISILNNTVKRARERERERDVIVILQYLQHCNPTTR